MKVTIARSALIKPLQMLSGVVEKRQTLAILSNVLVMVKDNTLSLTGTDLEIELIGSIPIGPIPGAESPEDGVTTVSARKLLDICRALPEEAILQIALEGEQLVLRSGTSRFLLTTLPAQDFPRIDAQPATFAATFSISQAKLKKLIGKTHFAMGQTDVRHYLNGALIDINQGVIKCVATDGHRLAFGSLQESKLGDTSLKIILPRKSVLELMRLLDANAEEEITVCVGENHFRVICGEYTFTSKLINAQYPEYDKLIPRGAENTIVTGREALKQALVRASILSNEKFRGIRLHLDNNLLRIVANNPEQEEAEEIIDLEYQGSGLEFGFNVAYLLDVISAIVTDNIRWSFSDPNSGVIIESTESDLSENLYVVMPMRL